MQQPDSVRQPGQIFGVNELGEFRDWLSTIDVRQTGGQGTARNDCDRALAYVSIPYARSVFHCPIGKSISRIIATRANIATLHTIDKNQFKNTRTVAARPTASITVSVE